MAVASAGPYGSLHLAPDRYHASTPPLSFLQVRCPSCHPTNSVKALKASGVTLESLKYCFIYVLVVTILYIMKNMKELLYLGFSIVGGMLQLSGSCIAQLKSKFSPSRQLTNSSSETSHSEPGEGHATAADTAHHERGPRIKHVCRRAAVVFGERATFPVVQSSPEINLSALPSYEKKHVVQQSAGGLLTWSFVT